VRDSPRSRNSPAADLLALIIFFPAGCAASCHATGRAGGGRDLFAADDNHAERDFRRRQTIEKMKT
jgi:hypothetical protein